MRVLPTQTSLPKDVYIAAIEYQPGNRQHVQLLLAAKIDWSGIARVQQGEQACREVVDVAEAACL